MRIDNPSSVEKDTQGQSNNPLWFSIRKNRLTSSNFGVVCKRKLNISQNIFVENTLLSKKDLSNVPAIKYGIANEAKAAKRYNEYMNASGHNVITLECGVIVSKTMPWLAASPDRKTIDNEFGHGLVEIKCPFSVRNLKPEDACKEPTFFCELINDKPALKREHQYYYQIQGQLGITGLHWCDFVVLFQKGLIIQRIKFNELFWLEMISKLTKYYQEHVMPVIVKSRL